VITCDPLSAESTRRTARRSASSKSKLIGCPVYCFCPVPGTSELNVGCAGGGVCCGCAGGCADGCAANGMSAAFSAVAFAGADASADARAAGLSAAAFDFDDDVFDVDFFVAGAAEGSAASTGVTVVLSCAAWAVGGSSAAIGSAGGANDAPLDIACASEIFSSSLSAASPLPAAGGATRIVLFEFGPSNTTARSRPSAPVRSTW